MKKEKHVHNQHILIESNDDQVSTSILKRGRKTWVQLHLDYNDGLSFEESYNGIRHSTMTFQTMTSDDDNDTLSFDKSYKGNRNSTMTSQTITTTASASMKTAIRFVTQQWIPMTPSASMKDTMRFGTQQ